MVGRYAIYYVPAPESQLYRSGSSILGRCVYEGQSLPRPALPGIPEELLAKHTRRAARYGFHSTIVAPFKTAASFDDLCAATAKLAAECRAFTLPKLAVDAVNNSFAAIVPESQPPELAELEWQFVILMNHYRLPLTELDIARRGQLPPRQAANLKKWGYHLVFEDFQFHLTVADSLPDAPDSFMAALSDYLEAALEAPLMFDRLGLFYQPSENEAFTCRQVFFLRDLQHEC
jgi:hypothetical protein